MKGRLPDSPELRLLKNDKAHAHKFTNVDVPKPSMAKAFPPEWLSERGKCIFNEFVKRVESMYPCSETDGYTITLYAQNQEQLEHLEVYLRINGCTYESETKFGYVVKERPEVGLHKECKHFALQCLKEFGLTPSARSRIKLPKKPEGKKNAFADLDETG